MDTVGVVKGGQPPGVGGLTARNRKTASGEIVGGQPVNPKVHTLTMLTRGRVCAHTCPYAYRIEIGVDHLTTRGKPRSRLAV